MRIIRANVREPLQVEGDVYALAACNDEGSRRLVEMMDEFGIANLDRLGEHIIETSRAGDARRDPQADARQVPNSVHMDGYDRPLTLAGEMTIGDDGIHVDYRRHLAGERLRHQCRDELHAGLHRVRGEVPGRARGAEQCRLARRRSRSARPTAACSTSSGRARSRRGTRSATCCPMSCSAACTRSWTGGVPAEGASSLWNPQIYGGADGRRGRGRRRRPCATCRRSAPSSSIAAAPARGPARTGST